MIKKGQLRRWKDGWGWHSGKTFVTVDSKIFPDNDDIRRLGRREARRMARKIWTILMDGNLEYEEHMDIERGSEVIG